MLISNVKLDYMLYKIKYGIFLQACRMGCGFVKVDL